MSRLELKIEAAKLLREEHRLQKLEHLKRREQKALQRIKAAGSEIYLVCGYIKALEKIQMEISETEKP